MRDLAFAVDQWNGEVRWTVDHPIPAHTFALQGDHVIGQSARGVSARDIRTGKVVWTTEIVARSLIVTGDEVFLCNDLGVFVLDAATGARRRQLKVDCSGQMLVSDRTLVTHTLGTIAAHDLEGKPRWRHRAANPVGLASYEDVLYFTTWTSVGMLHLGTGAPIATVELPGSQYRGAPVVAAGRLYVTDHDGVSCYGDPARSSIEGDATVPTR